MKIKNPESSRSKNLRVQVLRYLMLLLFFAFVNAVEYACFAPPIISGPKCTSNYPLDSNNENTLVTYTITEMEQNTNIHCFGLGLGYNTDACMDRSDNLGWKDMGILKEGDSQDLIWGTRIDFPAIQCTGEPLESTFKWSWDISYTKNNGCPFGNISSCCGNTCYDPHKEICCWDYTCPFIIGDNNDYDQCCTNQCCNGPNISCCPEVGCYNINEQQCCGNKICESGTRCCNHFDGIYEVFTCCPIPDWCSKAPGCEH
jgi:hypothetical protein